MKEFHEHGARGDGLHVHCKGCANQAVEDKARHAVHVDIKKGDLKRRQLCMVCGDREVEAHHSDYSKPHSDPAVRPFLDRREEFCPEGFQSWRKF